MSSAAEYGKTGCAAQQTHATETEETCTQYNMLKIARYLFRWSGAPSLADCYERTILNGLFGVLRMPADYEPSRHDLSELHLPEEPSSRYIRWDFHPLGMTL